VHAVPRGDLWRCYRAVNRSLLGQLRRGALLPIGLDDSSWRRGLPCRIVLHRRWCNLNDTCVHAVPRGDLRRYYADERSVLGQLHSRVLLPLWIRVRQRRNQRGHVQHVPKDV
jgi:hypothetical protein